MTQAAAAIMTDPESAPNHAIPSQLASFLAAKLCHDVASPTGAMINGLEMMRDPDHAEMREDLVQMVEASARKLLAMVHFDRVAFGAATSSESFSAEEIETLAQSAFIEIRPSLDWHCQIERFNKPQARAVLNLAQIAGGALATGGTVTLEVRPQADRLHLKAHAQGPRVRLKHEVATGLSGATLTEGMAGQWIQSYWLHTTVAEAGGTLTVDMAEDHVEILISMPL
ncbi:MAG: histidine phosphotransferase [Caulobacterales bacterium]|nr:histidine phosphotransferase [Caulobacterales bacterium]